MNSEDSSVYSVGQETFRVYVESNSKTTKSSLKGFIRWELTDNGFSTAATFRNAAVQATATG